MRAPYFRSYSVPRTKEEDERQLLARFVGYTRIEPTSPWTEVRYCPLKDGGEFIWTTRRWQPDKVRDDAFQLIGAMQDKGFRFECRNWHTGRAWQVRFVNEEKGIGITLTDSTLAKAIYRAALEIAESEKEDGG